MQAVTAETDAEFTCRMLEREPSLNRFFRATSRMIAVRDGDLAPDEDAARGEEDWCPGLPLTDLQAKVCRDGAFAKVVVEKFMALVAERARQLVAEKERVNNARP